MNETVLLQDAAPAPPSPGAQLAAARELSGLTVVDVARQLKLSPWQVEALESGDHRRLPGAVFVRGFIRNYARVVKLDAALLLANTDAGAPRVASTVPNMAPSADIPFPSGREFKWQKYAVAAIAVLVPVVIFEFYLGDDAPDADVNSRQVALPAPQVVAQQPAADTAAALVAPASAETSPPPAPSVGAAARAARKTDEQLVRFRFAQASWVEIRDRAGRRIFSQFNPAGTEQVVSGLPPLTLVVGNAKGVGLTYNEQPVDLAPHTKVDVARLTLE